MEEKKISVIVPVYNVEQYLSTCVDSIIRQSWRNLEIILVDDGSTDTSGKICDAYAKKDGRIRVIHKKNGGASTARNEGLAHMTGDYLAFVDSDDWISENALEILHQGLIEYDADCAVGACIRLIEKKDRLIEKKNKKTTVKCDNTQDAMKRSLLHGSAAWNRLYKRKVFDGIHFPEHIINEDEIVVLHVYAKCKRVVFLDQYTYYYRYRQGSVTTSAFSIKKLDFYTNTLSNRDYIEQTAPELLKYADYRIICALLYCYVSLLLKRNKSPEEKEKIRWLHTEVRRHRKMAKANSYCEPWRKLAMYLLSV